MEAIVTGSMTDLGNTVKVNAQMIAVESAKVFAVAATSIPKTGIVAELASKAVERRSGGSAPAVAASPAPTSKPAPAQASLKVEAKDFVFALQGCRRGGTNVTCSLLVTNLTEDRNLGIRSSRIFDTSGNAYNASLFNLGGTCCVTRLVSKIPTRGELSFDRTASDMNGIALLEIDAIYNGDFAVQFRDVPLSQRGEEREGDRDLLLLKRWRKPQHLIGEVGDLMAEQKGAEAENQFSKRDLMRQQNSGVGLTRGIPHCGQP